ncbi:hypothetical protein [Methylomarinum vadi]|uniref:hypothetical protein n=1 Tax=Methylomarinum vadi TaxID=438855 RepID=UPI0004DFA6B9|nr:hypothetical protein [Methylomarinum vadi]
MKLSTPIVILSLCALLLGCSKSNEINGRSLRTANRSVSFIKDRLPVEQRVAFEISFWSLRDAIRNNEEFLDTIDGKTPEEMIDLGKKLFQKRKSEGYKDYEQFASWEQMIDHYTQERIDQNRRKKADPRDRQNNVLYKL